MNEISLEELRIQGLSLDSRRLKQGDLFIALKGLVQDGRRYIPEAIKKGAVAILSDAVQDDKINSLFRADQRLSPPSVPIIYYSDLRNSLSHIAARFFDDPSRAIPVIGITGTNGKTSCSHFIAQIFSEENKRCGVMGTLGNGLLPALSATDCTTLDPIQTQEQLFNLKNLGAELVAMEVTSHALTQGRVEALHFHTGIFTNLTRDHLDYHQSMQNYFQAKQRLFTELTPKFSIVNLDDEHGQLLVQELIRRNLPTEIIGYTQNPKKNTENGYSLVSAQSITLDETGIKAVIHSPWGEGTLECPLLGNFNLSNILASLAAVIVQGVPFNDALKAIKNIKTVSGRMVTLGGEKNQPRVVVDYAHTPDALSKVLKALRAHCKGTLWCVFGCGGDRDRGKRSEMAKVVEELSDKIILTQDNPRTEDPNRIMEDIIAGFKNPNATTLQIDQDRRSAISLAVLNANSEDIILVAGKGHEPYQIIGTEKIPFSDQSEVIQALKRRIK